MSWPTKRLDECVKFLSGGTPKKSKPEYWDGEIPWVSSAEMTQRFLADTSLNITEAGLEAGSRLVPAGTTFAVVRGMSLAKEFRISLAQRAMAFNQDVKALIPKPGVDGRFIFYSLAAHATAIRDLATEAAHGTKKLEMDRLEGYVIHLPADIETQRIVASVAYAYDDLMVTNQRRIALLEDAVHRLYREWFVQLRYPGHELVPLQDGVPDGWQHATFSELVDVNPKTSFPKDIERPFVEMSVLSETSMVIGKPSARVIGGGAKFKNGDTLFARITPCTENGKTGFVQFLEGGDAVASGSTEFMVFRSAQVNPWWVYCMARDSDFREHAIRSMSGSDGRQRVNPKCFDQLMTLKPPQLVLAQFEQAVKDSFTQIESLCKQNFELARARDLLLPKLMSGQMDISGIPLPDEVAE